MKPLCTFVIVIIILLTMISSAVKPVLHKPFILENPDFKISGLSQRPIDLQSISMFKIGDVPIKTGESTPITSVTPVTINSETPIIPSDIKIIPSDFIQNVPINNSQPQQETAPQQPVNNSDKMLEQVEKMLNQEITPTNEQPKIQPPESSNNSKTEAEEEPQTSGCSICDQLKNPKFRQELIAWNKWRSDIQNFIMENSYIEAPYGTYFYFSFKVDENQHITNIKIISTYPKASNDILHIRSSIVSLNGDSLLKFPKGTNRKSVNFSGGFLMSDFEQLSKPSDFKDYEYIQTEY